MSTLRIASLLMFVWTTVLAEKPPIDSSQRTTLLRSWKTVRFGVYFDGSDYASRGNSILLQRLDSERATVSAIRGGSAGEWRLPVLVAVVPTAHATKLVEQALDFFDIAKREEPERGIVKNPTDRLIMFLDFVAGYIASENDEYQYRVIFDLSAETHTKFRKLIEDASKAPKN